MPDFYWDPNVARFRNELGEFVANAVVQGYVNTSLVETSHIIDALVEMAAGGTITPEVLESRMREEIKREHIRSYLLGIGGRGQMTQADYGSIGGDLAFQYRKLSDFIDEVLEGDLSEAQIRARARMYINSARQAFEKAKFKAKQQAGYTHMRWVLNPAIENCADCISLAGLGWQPIESNPFDGCRPGTGCTVCLTNCGCYIEYGVEPL